MQSFDSILGRLEPVGDIATVPRGAIVVHSGERPRHVAVLLEGTVEEIIGTSVVVSDEPGTLLGAERVFDDRVSVGTIRAVTNCSLLLVAPDQFRAVLDTNIGEWVLAHLDSRVRAARDALVAAYPDVSGAA
ncbi:MAG TPA: cyclic nucleotide-binding domain-containing protein [Acidimicrobiales bacterium]|nr:cyclic nucleotide-binding domain-containing protein [Acidimicrobiales bacterium]